MEPEEDDDSSTQPNSSATGLIIIGLLGILVIIGFLYMTMTG
ncbi:hypothetical protein [Dactylosporangium fulvum]|uniref:Uncharacterized protein n=1 Tax=Dactylosporangium fulvum TaxID=53359 RepID=A0ABY5VRP4_9ACTN|nr:hypothetical protein [Dactylosporangium fulvum]UWP79484.1 hypothetical protein Dfulv_30495 [Dactylosporangium fulvum]